MYLLFYTDRKTNTNDYVWCSSIDEARIEEAGLRRQGVILGPAYIFEKVETIYV